LSLLFVRSRKTREHGDRRWLARISSPTFSKAPGQIQARGCWTTSLYGLAEDRQVPGRNSRLEGLIARPPGRIKNAEVGSLMFRAVCFALGAGCLALLVSASGWPAAAASLPYRMLHVEPGLGYPEEGPSASPAEVAAFAQRFERRVERARQYGYNYLVFRGLENYVPGDERAARFRQYLDAAIRVAHAHGLKLLLYGDEAIYRPEWLARAGARASVKDPRFWEMLADKYRRLLHAFPELDGVATRVGEVIPYHGFEALDILHSAEAEPDPRLEERSRKFVLTVHRVVAGEFGKLFLYRTWATNDWEQHSVPAIFRATFTEAVPEANLLISIKLTKQDAWYYGSAFNPTFGQTRHATVAEAELYSQYHGAGTIVDFPIRWFASGLRYACWRGARGVLVGEPPSGVLASGIFTIFSRLAMDPAADEEQLTREWARQELGAEVAGAVAEILLDSAEAVRDTYYLPAFPSLGWNPLPHVRGTRIVARGDPLWDEGRGHDEFLQEIYLMSRPYLSLTRASVNRGHARFVELLQKFTAIRDRIGWPEWRDELQQRLEHSIAVATLLRDYVHTILSYGEYREHLSAAARERLAASLSALRASAESYRQRYRFFDLAGIDVTIKLASRMLEDPQRAEEILRRAPTHEELVARFARAREEDLRLLASDPKARKILSWQGTVDGRAVLRIRGREVVIENLSAMGVLDARAHFVEPVTARDGGRWLLRPIRARGIAYLMEAPSLANQGTASVYLDDPEPGNAIYEFELYWSDKTR